MKNSIYENINTVCSRDCYDTCSLKAVINKYQQKIISLKPDDTNPITQNFLCPRGIKDLERLQANRIKYPLLKKDNNFVRISWEESLKLISSKLQQTIIKEGPESLLSLFFAGNQGLLSSIYPQRLWNAIGATQTDCSLCTASGHAALNLHYGESYGLQPLELLNQKLIVFWGFNAAVSAPHIWSLAKKAKKENNAKIIVIDPIKTLTAKQADSWIQLFPEYDHVLANGIINDLIQRDKADKGFIEKWTLNYDKLENSVKYWTLEKTSAYTGLQKEEIELLSKLYSTMKPSATMIGIGLQKSKNGSNAVRTISFIPTVLGFHRNFFYSNSNAYSVDYPYITGASLTKKKINKVSQVSLAEKVKEGNFKFIFINCMNPARTLPDSNNFISGISKNNTFTVVHDTHWTETAKLANLILPAPTYLEKDDLVLPWAHNYIRQSKKIIEPLTNSKNEIYLIQKIAKSLNLNEDWLYKKPWDEIKIALKNSIDNDEFSKLLLGKTLKLKLKSKSCYPTPSGKISFKHIGKSCDVTNKQSCKEKNFILLSSSTPKYTSTQFQDVYGKIEPIVIINSADACTKNITNNEIIILSNEYGTVKLRAKISDKIVKGVLWTPRQGEDLSGIPVNSIMTPVPQIIGNGSSFNSTVVNIHKQ